MKPSAYWISGAVVCGVLAACVIATHDKPTADATTTNTKTQQAAAPASADGPAPGLTAMDDARTITTGAETLKKIVRSEEEWKQILSPKQYHILREKGTERAWSGDFLKLKDVGTYKCAGCGLPLFRSDGKFDSGCGWPSFFEPLEGAHITETEDTTLGMVRTEITCSRCGGHLGHVFHDGPPPTGLRYCVNSVSIEFDRAEGHDGKEPDRDAPADEGE